MSGRYASYWNAFLYHILSQGCYRNTLKLREGKLQCILVPINFSMMILFWVDMLLSVLVGSSCFDLIGLTRAYSALNVLVKLTKVYAMGPPMDHK